MRFGLDLLQSVVAHAMLVWLLIGLSWLPTVSPPPQQIISTQLLRRGEIRPKELLPQINPPPPSPSPPKPLPPPPAAAKPTPPPLKPTQDLASSRPIPAKSKPGTPKSPSKQPLQSALQRLKRMVAGSDQGLEDGDSDTLHQLADLYMRGVVQCLQSYFVVEGLGQEKAADLKASVLLKVAGNGVVTSIKLMQSSQVGAFDQAVLQAAEHCRNLDKPPASLRYQLAHDGIEVIYSGK